MRMWLIQWKAQHKPSKDIFAGLSVVVAETRDEAEHIARDKITEELHMIVFWHRSMTFDFKPGLKYQDHWFITS